MAEMNFAHKVGGQVSGRLHIVVVCIVMAYKVMAYIVMTYIVMAYVVMASIVIALLAMACTVMTHLATAHVVMAHIVMTLCSYGQVSGRLEGLRESEQTARREEVPRSAHPDA